MVRASDRGVSSPVVVWLADWINETPVPLVMAMGLLLALAAYPGLWVSVPLLLLEALFLYRLRVKLHVLRHRLFHVVAFAGVLAITRPFFHQGPGISMGGLFEAIALFLRVLAGAGLLTILGVLMDPIRLAVNLRGWRLGPWGVPPFLAEVLVMTMRYVSLLDEEARRMMNAGRVRLGFAGWRASVKTVGAIAGAVLWRAVDRSDSVWRAMVARGYLKDGVGDVVSQRGKFTDGLRG